MYKKARGTVGHHPVNTQHVHVLRSLQVRAGRTVKRRRTNDSSSRQSEEANHSSPRRVRGAATGDVYPSASSEQRPHARSLRLALQHHPGGHQRQHLGPVRCRRGALASFAALLRCQQDRGRCYFDDGGRD